LQAICMAAGLGMLVTLLWKKEDTASDYYQQGRQQVQAVQHSLADTMRDQPWRAYYRRGRQQVQAVQHSLADTMRDQPWRAYYRRGRQQAEAVEYTLADAIRAKPLQAMFITAGIGMLLGVLVKK
jgi:ElaB/YqjD/DUF883 family membrane-anchored ribosome-binding protein